MAFFPVLNWWFSTEHWFNFLIVFRRVLCLLSLWKFSWSSEEDKRNITPMCRFSQQVSLSLCMVLCRTMSYSGVMQGSRIAALQLVVCSCSDLLWTLWAKLIPQSEHYRVLWGPWQGISWPCKFDSDAEYLQCSV